METRGAARLPAAHGTSRCRGAASPSWRCCPGGEASLCGHCSGRPQAPLLPPLSGQPFTGSVRSQRCGPSSDSLHGHTGPSAEQPAFSLPVSGSHGWLRGPEAQRAVAGSPELPQSLWGSDVCRGRRGGRRMPFLPVCQAAAFAPSDSRELWRVLEQRGSCSELFSRKSADGGGSDGRFLVVLRRKRPLFFLPPFLFLPVSSLSPLSPFLFFPRPQIFIEPLPRARHCSRNCRWRREQSHILVHMLR